MDKSTNVWTNAWTNVWTNIWTNVWTNVWINVWTNESTVVWINVWTDESTNESTDGPNVLSLERINGVNGWPITCQVIRVEAIHRVVLVDDVPHPLDAQTRSVV